MEKPKLSHEDVERFIDDELTEIVKIEDCDDVKPKHSSTSIIMKILHRFSANDTEKEPNESKN